MSIPDRLFAALAGRYRIEREIGRGGMATVYLAHDVRHDRDVAIKVMSSSVAAQMTSERFLREIRVTAQLTHPQILPLLDSGVIESGEDTDAGVPFYVMPYVSGETLRARMTRAGSLSQEETARVVRDVADALDYAHGRGVVHRDVKPENILLLEGHAIVADFGIARAMDTGTSRVTRTGVVLGTPVYMSPEQAMGDGAIDGRADQYALACVAYEMLTGMPPYGEQRLLAMLAAHAVDPVPSVRATRPELPVTMDAAIRRAMSKLPAERFPTATAFASELVRIQIAPERRQGRAKSVAAALMLVTGLAIGYRVFDSRRVTALETRTATAARIAVLPFRSVSPDPSDQYFAEGMTDEMISSLSAIGGIKVMARSSVAALITKETTSPAAIAKQLGVGSMLEGSVRKEGARVRISVNLSDPLSGESLWSQTYDKTITDVFLIQRDVARAVAGALRITLAGRAPEQLAKSPTSNSGAYELYLRASALLNVSRQARTRSRLDSATVLLRAAVGQDSTFALGWAALASAYTSIVFSYGDKARLRDSAVVAVSRAFALDTALAEAYLARSELEYTREGGWRMDDALRDALHAVILKPGWADAHGDLGAFLLHIGFQDEGLRELQTTLALDPQSQFAVVRLPRAYWQAGHYEQALVLLERNRGAGLRVFEEAQTLGYLNRPAEGLARLEKYATSDGVPSGDKAASEAVLLARLGRTAEARARIADASAMGSSTSHFHHAAYVVATAWSIMGQRDSAVAWLERVASDGMPAYSLFAHDPALAPLKGTRGYDDLIIRLRKDADRYRQILQSSAYTAP